MINIRITCVCGSFVWFGCKVEISWRHTSWIYKAFKSYQTPEKIKTILFIGDATHLITTKSCNKYSFCIFADALFCKSIVSGKKGERSASKTTTVKSRWIFPKKMVQTNNLFVIAHQEQYASSTKVDNLNFCWASLK